MVPYHIVLAYMTTMFVLYVGTVTFFWLRQEKMMHRMMAYMKAANVAEAEAALKPPAPPVPPSLTEADRLRTIQSSAYKNGQ